MIRSRIAIAAVFCVALAPAVARADDPVQKIMSLNKKALEDYDILEFESAKKALIEALNVAKKAAMDTHPVTARTYVHLGIVYVNGFKDRFKGFQQFQRAIQIQGDIKLDKNLATPELQEVFESAFEEAKANNKVGPKASAAAGKMAAAPPPAAGRKPARPAADDEEEEEAPAPKKAPPPKPAAKPVAAKPAAKKPAADEDEEEAPTSKKAAAAAAKKEQKKVEIEEPDLPANVNALDCPNADEAPPQKDIALRCAVAASLGQVSKVFLQYRPPGKEDFIPVPMVQSKKGWWNGVIPGNVVTGKSLQFFFEAKDKAGKPLASNGRGDSPNLMIIREGAKVVGSGATAILDAQKSAPLDLSSLGEAEENPLEAKQNASPKLKLGVQDRSQEKKVRVIGDRTMWVGVMAGDGFGMTFGQHAEYRTDLSSPSVAPSLDIHGALEVGYYLNPQLAVSIQSRNQYISQSSLSGAAKGAHAVMGRVLYFLATGKQRVYGAAMAGVGIGKGLDAAFRLVSHPDPDNPDFKDTAKGGPAVGGAGVGYAFAFNPTVEFVAETNALIGAGTQMAAVLDLHVGLSFILF